MHASLERRCQEALADSMHPSELIKLLLEDEQLARQEQQSRRLLTKAKFRSICTLEEWDTSFNRGLTKPKLKEMALASFYHKRQNLLITGKTGVGKTHLAMAVGNQLCQSVISTAFFSTNLFFEKVLAKKASGRSLKMLKKLAGVQVLILGDFTLRNYTHDEANTLLEIVEGRCRRGVIIVKTQLSREGLKGLFEVPVVGEAITDRLKNPSDLIELAGDSCRKKLEQN